MPGANGSHTWSFCRSTRLACLSFHINPCYAVRFGKTVWVAAKQLVDVVGGYFVHLDAVDGTQLRNEPKKVTDLIDHVTNRERMPLEPLLEQGMDLSDLTGQPEQGVLLLLGTVKIFVDCSLCKALILIKVHLHSHPIHNFCT